MLTQVHWPTYAPTQVKLQPELAEMQDVFKTYYLEKYSGRRLGFLNSLGTCVLKSHFETGKKELSVSVYQAVVLLLFNETDHISFASILDSTEIDEDELKRTLQSLACGKVRVLRKRPEGRDVELDDVFHVNQKFSHKVCGENVGVHVCDFCILTLCGGLMQLMRIKINQIQMKETVEENHKTTEDVFQDRQYQVVTLHKTALLDASGRACSYFKRR